MEPTQFAGSSAPDQAPSTQPTTTANAETSGSATSDTSNGTGQSPVDGKNWMEFASLQKVVDQLPQGVRDFCTTSWTQAGKSLTQVGGQVSKMSTTQKVAGAAALVGIGYLAMRSGKKPAGKSSGLYQPYRGNSMSSSSAQRPAQGYSSSGYASGSSQSYSAGPQSDSNRRMDQGPGHWNSSSFDRENVSRSGGSYSTPSDAAAGYSSGSANPSSSTYRSAGSQGHAGSPGAADPDDFGSSI